MCLIKTSQKNLKKAKIEPQIGQLSGRNIHTNLKAGSGELISRWTAAGDGVGEERGPVETTEALRGFLGVSGRCGCIVKEFSIAHT